MNRIVMHVGVGKTGTSSLQAYLSENSGGRLGNSQHIYCCIDRDGNVISGNDLKSRARATKHGYLSSFHGTPSLGQLDRIGEQIHALASNGAVPIFSQEDWSIRPHLFKDSNFFQEIGCEADVVAYVRPQVDWFNSGWWQWWAWMDEFGTPDDVIAQWGHRFMRFGAPLAKWKGMEGVSSLTVRLHAKDIIADFLGHLGIEGAPPVDRASRVNVGLSPLLIRLYRAIPELRGPHGAEVDSVLGKILELDGKAPWVVSPELARNIIEGVTDDNEAIKAMLSEDQKLLMEQDDRWWSPKPYEKKVPSEDLQSGLSSEEYHYIISSVVTALMNRY